jgi:uracil-DNA glycosylase
MTTSIFLEGWPVHESWTCFFSSPEIQDMLSRIQAQLTEPYTPFPQRVLRFAMMDLNAVRVIIYGRDPYPQLTKQGERVATGRAFEVNGVTSWKDTEINSSLKNVLKLIHKSYFNLEKVASIGKVREDIDAGTFQVLPPNDVFSYWEKNGTLFLNRSFTCKIGTQETASGSHEAIWTDFFERLLNYIYHVNPHIKHFLWGTAQEFAPLLKEIGVKEEDIYRSNHPSDRRGDMGGYQRNARFYNNPCFKDTMAEIRWVNTSF